MKLFNRVEKSGQDSAVNKTEQYPIPLCSSTSCLYLMQRENASSWHELHLQRLYPHIGEYRKEYKIKLEETISGILF